MGIRDFFKALVGGQPPVDVQADKYVQYQKQSAEGMLATSRRSVAFMGMNDELRVFLLDNLKVQVQNEGVRYSENPSAEQACHAQIVITDGTPMSYARMHDKYDQVLRIKKSMGKTRDVYCAIGPRKDYKKYPRGTYANVMYFCMVEGKLDQREPDLPAEGLATVEGPRLYNLADIGQVVLAKLKAPAAPKAE